MYSIGSGSPTSPSTAAERLGLPRAVLRRIPPPDHRLVHRRASPRRTGRQRSQMARLAASPPARSCMPTAVPISAPGRPATGSASQGGPKRRLTNIGASTPRWNRSRSRTRSNHSSGVAGAPGPDWRAPRSNRSKRCRTSSDDNQVRTRYPPSPNRPSGRSVHPPRRP